MIGLYPGAIQGNQKHLIGGAGWRWHGSGVFRHCATASLVVKRAHDPDTSRSSMYDVDVDVEYAGSEPPDGSSWVSPEPRERQRRSRRLCGVRNCFLEEKCLYEDENYIKSPFSETELQKYQGCECSREAVGRTVFFTERNRRSLQSPLSPFLNTPSERRPNGYFNFRPRPCVTGRHRSFVFHLVGRMRRTWRLPNLGFWKPSNQYLPVSYYIEMSSSEHRKLP